MIRFKRSQQFDSMYGSPNKKVKFMRDQKDSPMVDHRQALLNRHLHQQNNSKLFAELANKQMENKTNREKLVGDINENVSEMQCDDEKIETFLNAATPIDDKQLFSITELELICKKFLTAQRKQLKEEYDNVLKERLSEQYDTFVKFTHDNLRRQLESQNHQPSYFF